MDLRYARNMVYLSAQKDVTLWKKRTQGKLDTLKKTITMTYQFKTDKSIVPEGA